MTLNEAEKIQHVEQRKYDMLLQCRKQINDRVDEQHTALLKAKDRVNQMKGADK